MTRRIQFRRWIAKHMRFTADRIDDYGAPRLMTALTFTFEEGEGIRTRTDGKGCKLWYIGRDDYEEAFTEADTDWTA